MRKEFYLFIFLLLIVFNGSGQDSFSLTLQTEDVQSQKNRLKSLSIERPENAKRFRAVAVNPAIQKRGIMTLYDTLHMELFPGEYFKSIVVRSNEIRGNPSFTAKVLGYENSYVFISSSNGRSLITIEIPEEDKLFRIKYNPETGKHVLIDVDKIKKDYIEEGPPVIPPKDNEEEKKRKKKNHKSKAKSLSSENKTNTKSSIIAGYDGPVVITLLIVYTPAAEKWAADNEGGINNTIAALMNRSQLALDNSNTNILLHLVHLAEVDYIEWHDNDDLVNLRSDDDGYMDEVHTWRDNYSADVVVLLEETGFTGGLGYLLSNESGSPAYAFSLTRVQQASWTYTVIHEIGHNMGAHHHKDQTTQPGPGLFDFSAGGRWVGNDNERYCSVMTYQSGDYFDDGENHLRVPYFSDPNMNHQGVPTGDAEHADNVRTLNSVKTVVSNYRVGNDIPGNLAISSTTLIAGTTDCFNATNTIAVAGDGDVIVESGASAEFIAGQSIRFLPGFHAEAGSYVNGRITTSGDYCIEAPAAIVAQQKTNVNEKEDATVDAQENDIQSPEMVVYPNPNNGEFTVEFRNFEDEIRVMLFNSMGQMVYNEQTTEKQIQMHVPDLKSGMYFLKAVNKNKRFSQKIVVQ